MQFKICHFFVQHFDTILKNCCSRVSSVLYLGREMEYVECASFVEIYGLKLA